KAGPDALADPEAHYGRAVERNSDPVEALRRLAANGAGAVVDLADEPVLAGADRMRLAAHVLPLGLDYEAPGMVLRAPHYHPGASVPPLEADRTVCVVGSRVGALEDLGPYRLLRADLALVIDAADAELAADVAAVCPGEVLRCELRTQACEPVPEGARVALFTT